jgi:hypothetical protein
VTWSARLREERLTPERIVALRDRLVGQSPAAANLDSALGQAPIEARLSLNELLAAGLRLFEVIAEFLDDAVEFVDLGDWGHGSLLGSSTMSKYVRVSQPPLMSIPLTPGLRSRTGPNREGRNSSRRQGSSATSFPMAARPDPARDLAVRVRVRPFPPFTGLVCRHCARAIAMLVRTGTLTVTCRHCGYRWNLPAPRDAQRCQSELRHRQ